MKNLLLPYPWKIIGLFLTFFGISLAILYTWFDFKIRIPVFAVFSSFLETRMFVTFKTNFADELILIFLIAGFGLMVFSKERTESEILDSLRIRAFAKAILINNIFLLLSVMFVFGSGFLSILAVNLFSVSVLYLIFFNLLRHNSGKQNQ